MKKIKKKKQKHEWHYFSNENFEMDVFDVSSAMRCTQGTKRNLLFYTTATTTTELSTNKH